MQLLVAVILSAQCTDERVNKVTPALFAVRAYHGLSIAAFTTGYSTLVVDFSPVRQRGDWEVSPEQ